MRRKSALLLLGALVACAHAGGGEGVLESPKTPSGASTSRGEVVFTWSSGSNSSTGDIRATLPDGTQFDGTYLQVTSQATVQDVGTYYDAWAMPGWGVARPWYQGEAEGFVQEYSGKAVAHLKSQDGTRMRCTFVLRKPLAGMQGGATGQCQLSSGETVFDAELREHKGESQG